MTACAVCRTDVHIVDGDLTDPKPALVPGHEIVGIVAEVGGDLAETEMKAFTAGDTHLNSAYGFDFLYAEALTPALVAKAMAAWPGKRRHGVAEGWPSWAFENHDAPRAVSRALSSSPRIVSPRPARVAQRLHCFT